MKVKHEGKTINSTKVNWNEDELYIYIKKKLEKTSIEIVVT
jgi:hypothetical protein